MQRKVMLILFLMLGIATLHGMENKDTLVLISKRYQDSIVVKWAPNDSYLWYLGVTNGYRVERQTNGGPWEILETKKMPLNQESLKNRILLNEDQDNLIVQYTCLYDDWDNVTSSTDNMHDFVTKSEIFKNRYFMAIMSASLDKIAARASGLTYVDQNISNGSIYKYRVSLLAPSGNIILQSEEVQAKFVNNPSIYLEAETTNYIVELRWDRSFSEQYYTSYWIERRQGDGKWKKMTDAPYVFGLTQHADNPEYITYTDTLLDKKVYEYRISGRDMFADEGYYSNLIKAQYTDKTPPVVSKVIEGKVLENYSIKITWSHNHLEDVKYFAIAKSRQYEGPYILIHDDLLSSSDLTFVDTEINPSGNTYYVIYAFDEYGNFSTSLPYAVTVWDHTPPKTPTNFSAVIDSNGLVNLSWNKNTEKDLAGYRIFSAQSKNNFINTVDLTSDNYYKEKLKIDSHDELYYYRIAAVDKSGNVSKLSTIQKVLLPDIIPPTKAFLKSVKQVEDHILIEWERSLSPDVVNYEILRKTKDDTLYHPIKKIDAVISSYQDNNIDLTKTYMYMIRCTDDANNVSLTDIVKTVKCSPYYRKTTFNSAQAEYDETTNTVKLHWIIDSDNVDKIWILKSSNGRDFIDKAYIDKKEKSYIDSFVKSNKRYSYQLVPINKNGSYGIETILNVSTK